MRLSRPQAASRTPSRSLRGSQLGFSPPWLGLLVVVGLAFVGLGCGCGDPSPSESDRPDPVARDGASRVEVKAEANYEAVIASWPAPPSEEDWTAEDTQKVSAACQGCHLLTPPEALPKARWRRTIPSMREYPVPVGLEPLTDEQLSWALAFYERRAPQDLPALEHSGDSDSDVNFSRKDFTPRGLERERIPAVSQVQFLALNDPVRLDVIVTELRSSTLMVLPPWAPASARSLRPLQGNLNYPARVLPLELDGRQSFVVASMGDLNPTDDRSGTVSQLTEGEGRRFRPNLIMDDLGRACDVQSGDMDGDGDADWVICAFGWKSSGELVLLESFDSGAGPRFDRRRIDSRNGFLQADLFDWDSDGDLDVLAAVAQEHEEVLLYLNDGSGTFTKKVLHRAPHPAWGLSGIERVDLDQDGDFDVVVSNGDTLDDNVLKPYHGVGWLENRGGFRFQYRRIGDLYGCEAAAVGDMDGDGDLDVAAVAFLPQISPRIWKERALDSVAWFEQSTAGWRRHSIEQGSCIHPTIDLGDYDADGDVDVVVGNYVWIRPGGSPMIRADYVTVFTQE